MDGVGAPWWSLAVRASAKTRPLGPALSLCFAIAGVYSPFAGHSLSSGSSVLVSMHWEMLKAAGSDSSSWEELFPSDVTEDWEVWGSSLAAQDFLLLSQMFFS